MPRHWRGGNHLRGTNHPCPIGVAGRLPRADRPQNRTTNYTHTSTRPLPYHRQPSLSSWCITQGLGEETFCLQQDGVGKSADYEASDVSTISLRYNI